VYLPARKFEYRIDIIRWLFVLAGSIALFIARLTVSVQSLKAANNNPVEALRYEQDLLSFKEGI
jgi:putative ABC transport system permease protein